LLLGNGRAQRVLMEGRHRGRQPFDLRGWGQACQKQTNPDPGC
jgi:hypothetical protein